jgi:hypothetical protein
MRIDRRKIHRDIFAMRLLLSRHGHPANERVLTRIGAADIDKSAASIVR